MQRDDEGISKGRQTWWTRKDKGDEAREEGRVMYVGDDHGYIISVEGYAENIRSVMGDFLPSSRANVSGLSARPGKIGTLFVTDQTRITTLLEECHYDEGQAFPYHTSEITNDFATWEHAQGVVGAYIALVLKVSNVELKYTDKGDP